MRIALLGYGKMGIEIESIAIDRGHSISLKVTSANADEVNNLDSNTTDVAIDFSQPGTVINNINSCFNKNIPCVVGTTGWYNQLNEIVELCNQKKQALLYASNFSPGVLMLFALNKKLAQMMNSQPNYTVSLEEIHHTRKLDAPSGTALSLINDIQNEINEISGWEEYAENKEITKDSKNTIAVKAIREGNVTGTHIVSYTSAIDQITIKHEAYNRKGFATGAVLAAEWLQNKKGVFTMNDVLQIHS